MRNQVTCWFGGDAPCRGRNRGNVAVDTVQWGVASWCHGHWFRPQGDCLSCQLSSGGQHGNIAVPVGCAQAEPRRVYPQPDTVRNLGLSLLATGYNESEANHEMCLRGRCAIQRVRRTAIRVMRGAQPEAMRPPVIANMLQPHKRSHVWYAVALAPPGCVAEPRGWCGLEGR